jgi:hypothetical protein
MDFYSLDAVDGLTHIAVKDEVHTLFFSDEESASAAYASMVSASQLSTTLVITGSAHWKPETQDHAMLSSNTLLASVTSLSSGVYGTCSDHVRQEATFYIEDTVHTTCETILQVEGQRLELTDVLEHANITVVVDVHQDDMYQRKLDHPSLHKIVDHSQAPDGHRRLGLFSWAAK